MPQKHRRPGDGPHETGWALLEQMAAVALDYVRRAHRYSSENHHRIAVSRAGLTRSRRVLSRIEKREQKEQGSPFPEAKRPPKG